MYEMNSDEYNSDDDRPNLVPVMTRKHKTSFSFRRSPIKLRKSVSEASMYRTGSRFSIKSVGMANKTLDYLMSCFWVCSPGCQKTF